MDRARKERSSRYAIINLDKFRPASYTVVGSKAIYLTSTPTNQPATTPTFGTQVAGTQPGTMQQGTTITGQPQIPLPYPPQFQSSSFRPEEQNKGQGFGASNLGVSELGVSAMMKQSVVVSLHEAQSQAVPAAHRHAQTTALP